MYQATDNSSNVNKFGAVVSQDFSVLASLTECPIAKLWALCWEVDPFGNNFKPLKNVNIPDSSFRKARKALKDAGLFDFVPKKNSRDSRKTDYWMVRNLHAVRSHLYGHSGENEEKIDATEGTLDATTIALDATRRASILPETHTQQASQHPLNKRTKKKILKEEKTAPESALVEPTDITEDDPIPKVIGYEELPPEQYTMDDLDRFIDILKLLRQFITLDHATPKVKFYWEDVEHLTSFLIADGKLSKATLEMLKANTVFEYPKREILAA